MTKQREATTISLTALATRATTAATTNTKSINNSKNMSNNNSNNYIVNKDSNNNDSNNDNHNNDNNEHDGDGDDDDNKNNNKAVRTAANGTKSPACEAWRGKALSFFLSGRPQSKTFQWLHGGFFWGAPRRSALEARPARSSQASGREMDFWGFGFRV